MRALHVLCVIRFRGPALEADDRRANSRWPQQMKRDAAGLRARRSGNRAERLFELGFLAGLGRRASDDDVIGRAALHVHSPSHVLPTSTRASAVPDSFLQDRLSADT